MKAVIVDLQGKSAAALCEDGTFREVPDIGYALGQTIELQASLEETPVYPKEDVDASEPLAKLPAESGTRPAADYNTRTCSGRGFFKMQFSRIAAAAAACFLVLGISAGTVWAMPYGTVYVDNGSSLAYTINRFDYVLDVNAQDESGEKLLEELNLKKIVNKKIDRAVAETLDQIEKTEDENGTQNTEGSAESREIQIITDIKNEKHAKSIQDRLEKITASASGEDSESGSPVENGSGGNPDNDFENNPSLGTPANTDDKGLPNREDINGKTQDGTDNGPGTGAGSDPASNPADIDTAVQGQKDQTDMQNPSNPRQENTAGNSDPSGQAPSGTPGTDSSSLPGDSGAKDNSDGQEIQNSTQIPEEGQDSGIISGTDKSDKNYETPSESDNSGQDFESGSGDSPEEDFSSDEGGDHDESGDSGHPDHSGGAPRGGGGPGGGPGH